MNDKVNEIVYNKATMYKEKTLEALRKPKENISPTNTRRLSREQQQQQQQPMMQSDLRLQVSIQDESMSQHKVIEEMTRQIRNQASTLKATSSPLRQKVDSDSNI